MTIALVRAVDIAVKGAFPPDDVQIDGHGFYIRSLANKNRLNPGETGYFRHEHIGEDDRVFFSIQVTGSGTYVAKITRVEYRGPGNKGGFKDFDLIVNEALNSDPRGAIIAKILKFLQDANLQSGLDGDWEVAAAKVVDAIGRRMAVKL